MTPRRAAPFAALAAALAIGAGWYLIIFKSEPAITKPYPIEFQEYSSNLYRQGFLWKVPLPPAFPVIDVHVFLIKSGQDYLLVDVGAPGEEYERIIGAGLQEALKGGKLRNVILTHGHIDHVGALASLLKAYPDLQVIFHEKEAPFLTGKASYGDIPADSSEYLKEGFVVLPALPASRILLLNGESGDLSDAKGPSGQKPAWAIPKGVVYFHHSPGHAPGHVVYLHKPSSSLIAGDVFGNLGKISLPPPMFTPNTTEARSSLIKVASLDFEKAYCAHDCGVGVSREYLQQSAKNV